LQISVKPAIPFCQVTTANERSDLAFYEITLLILILISCAGVGSKSVDVVKMLLSAGVDVNHKNMLGMNALLLVAGYGNDHLVRLIIQSGADPYSTNDFGHTALHLAIVGKRSQVCQLVLAILGLISQSRPSKLRNL